MATETVCLPGSWFECAENHRSGMIWSLTRRCEPLTRGLRIAGFTGGWLDADEAHDPGTRPTPSS